MTGTLLHLAARAADSALDAATIASARAELAARHAHRTLDRGASVLWWTWLVMRPRPTR